MSSKTARILSNLFNLVVILAMFFGPLASVRVQAFTDTNQEDYAPGSVVTVYGDNRDLTAPYVYQPGETVVVTVTQPVSPDPLTCEAVVADDGLGSWSCQLQLSSDPAYAVGLYTYTTLGLTSGTTESHSFMDAAPVFEQCRNADGVGPCTWNGGALNGSNSLIYEGDGTVQRLLITGLTSGSHTISFDYNTYIDSNTGSKHAYDYLVTYDFSEHWVDQSVLCAGLNSACLTWIPDTASFTQFSGTNDAGEPVTGPADQVMTIFNGDLNLVSAPYIFDSKDPSFMRIDVTFTTTAEQTSVLLAFAGHVATQIDWGIGKSAVAINGANYHIKYEGRDNQMMTDAIPPMGTLIVVKDTVPNSADDFQFTISRDGSPIDTFYLDDDLDGTLPNTTAPNYVLSAATYNVAELAVAGYATTSDCVDGTTHYPANAVVLQANHTVTCTFTNTRDGKIIINKVATGEDATFAYTTTGGNGFPAGFNVTTSGGTGSQTYSVAPGTFSVTESAKAGWNLTSSSCSSGTPDSFTVGAGETVTCTFNNQRVYNKDLTVSKTAVASFGRTYKWLIDKSVDQTQINIAQGGTATFNYSVKVTPDGYTDGAWAVSGKITVANPNSFDVTGVNVTDAIDNGGVCTVTNGTNVTVPANGNVVLDYSCTYAAAPNPAAGTNTATATWNAATFDTQNSSASGTASVDFSAVTPTETNKTITVIDDKTDPANPVTLGTWNWADREHSFTYSLDKAGVAGSCTDYTNTAVIDETDQSDSQKVTVCVGSDLTVSKTATASLSRTYHWLIDKSVEDSRIEIAAGGIATFNYSVKVTPNGFTDSAFALGGTITVTNPNDWEDVTVSVSDTLDQGGTCSITEAAPYVVPKGGSLTLHYTCTTDGTTEKNTATVSWDKDAYFTPSGSASADAAVSFSLAGETNKTITVVDDKTDPGNPVTLGTWNWADGENSFTYSIDKQGVAGTCTDYTNTAVIDETDQFDSQTVTVCVGLDLSVAKTAAGTFDRTYLWQISKAVDQTLVKIAEGGSYTFHYTVDVAQTGISDAGWTLSGTITISNPNDWEDITLTSLSDVVDNGGACTLDQGPYVVPKSGSLDVNYTCSFASAPSSYSGINTATATWDKAAAFTPTGTASGSKEFMLSQLGAINKTVHVTDTYGGDLGTVAATDAAPFAKGTFTYERTISGVAGTCTTYDNTATITETNQTADKSVTLCVGKDLTITKTAEGTFDRTYLWDISKVVDKTQINIASGGKATFIYTVTAWQTGFTDSGWVLGGTITVTNPNDWESITADITDTVNIGGAGCTVTDGNDVVIPAGESVTRTYTCNLSTQPNYSGINTATVTWDKAIAFTPNGSASGTATFTLGQEGAVNKTITVTDSLGGSLGKVTATDAAPFASQSFTYSHDFSGIGGTCTHYDNTAEITETVQQASQSVTVCVGLDLIVTKTAAGTFDRTYHWLIDKSVDDTRIEIADGGTATFNYTVGVTSDGFTDSGWALVGTITVTNPNNWEAIIADVTDVYDGGGACSVTGGEDVVVPAGGSVSLDYACTFGSQPAYEGTNTATAAWDKDLYHTPTGTASGTADVTLALKGETHRTITVMDDQTTGTPVTLGTSDFYTGPFEFKYSLTKSGVAGTCTDYTNTAEIDETDQSDSQEVTVCVGQDLTISKTATPTFTRTWDWTISKDFDATYNLFAGDSVNHGYQVTVSPTSTDSLWRVAGTISIENPNDWEDITLTSLSDVVNNGGACTVASGPYIIPAGGTLGVTYSCTYASKPVYSATNTATATWDKAAYFTPNAAVSGSASFTFANPAEINPVITVDDNNLTGEDWSANRAYSEWAYTRDFACSTNPDDYTDGKYSYSLTNAATINETGQTDTAKVDVTCIYPQLKINKTVNMLPFSGPELTFQLRQGASMTSLGTTLETAYANLANNGQVVFTTILKPGTYQLVELIPVGYVPSYVWGTYGEQWFRPGYLPGQGGQDPVIWVAVNFVVNENGSITFQPGTAQQEVPLSGIVNIDNQVGQMPFTIGYWKNHASAKESNGGQDPVLDQMLYKATQAGQTISIGTLALPGGITPDDAGDSATYAVRLLNKSTIETNKKKASDPAWNLAAQLLGYRLNAVLGSWLNPVAIQASDIAQEMLVGVGFDGQTYTKPPKAILAKWTANMNYLASVLDAYNNSTLVITSLTMPYPGVGYSE